MHLASITFSEQSIILKINCVSSSEYLSQTVRTPTKLHSFRISIPGKLSASHARNFFTASFCSTQSLDVIVLMYLGIGARWIFNRRQPTTPHSLRHTKTQKQKVRLRIHLLNGRGNYRWRVQTERGVVKYRLQNL